MRALYLDMSPKLPGSARIGAQASWDPSPAVADVIIAFAVTGRTAFDAESEGNEYVH
jgi:hypothetical protein